MFVNHIKLKAAPLKENLLNECRITLALRIISHNGIIIVDNNMSLTLIMSSTVNTQGPQLIN